MNILVTGGAGYIGSVTSNLLCKKGHRVFILDNLSTGFIEAVPNQAEFIEGDILDQVKLVKALTINKIQAVIHFAAKLIVPESIAQPYEYYQNNVVGGLSVIEACRQSGVEYLIFSSTAAVYGNPESVPVNESATPNPLNPYGTSKLMVEQFLRDYSSAYGLKYAVLRYFNVAGATVDLCCGQRTLNATHLIKVAAQVATKKRNNITIFGNDYPTQDGTGVRDYIHVEDLAQAHLDALRYLSKGGASETFNCGYGHGFSVLEVINKFNEISGISLNATIGPRRPGDAAVIVADASKARKVLDWNPKFDSLDLICRTALDWEKRLL